MNYERISEQVDSWISDMDMPTRANLKPIRMFSDLQYEDEDEQEAWSEFIANYVSREHQILKLISREEFEYDFWVELDEDGCDVSAFNTHDFERNHKGFSLYHWQLKKLCETVKHMAIDFSILKDENVKMKVRDRAFEFIRTKGARHKERLFKVWLDYAYWE